MPNMKWSDYSYKDYLTHCGFVHARLAESADDEPTEYGPLDDNQVMISGSIVEEDERAFLERAYGKHSATSSVSFASALKAVKGDEVEVLVNSRGGYMHEGAAISDFMLAERKKRTVNVRVTGISASAATWAMLSGDTLTFSKLAFAFFHPAQGVAFGNSREVLARGDSLAEDDLAVAAFYEELMPLASLGMSSGQELMYGRNNEGYTTFTGLTLTEHGLGVIEGVEKSEPEQDVSERQSAVLIEARIARSRLQMAMQRSAS